jgi:hypothetical protein
MEKMIQSYNMASKRLKLFFAKNLLVGKIFLPHQNNPTPVKNKGGIVAK